jgi:membrane-anchored glycerophosphoryl diester phosphodiesterase (GDPDase)
MGSVKLVSPVAHFCGFSVSVKNRHLLRRAKKRIDFSLVALAMAIVICFVGLSVIVFGGIVGEDTFQLGFKIVIGGLVLIIVWCFSLMVSAFCSGKFKRRTT